MRKVCLRKICDIAMPLVLALVFVFMPVSSYAGSGTDSLGQSIGEHGSQIKDGNIPEDFNYEEFDKDIQELLDNYQNGSVSDTVKEFNEYFSNCLVCDVFGIIFDSINELSYVVWERGKTSFLAFFAVLLALWLVFKFGGALASMVPQSPADFWHEVGVVLLKAIFVAVILTFSIGDFIGSYIVSPVVYGASSFAEAVAVSYSKVNPFSEQHPDFDVSDQSLDANRIDSSEFLEAYSASDNELTGVNKLVKPGSTREGISLKPEQRLTLEGQKYLAAKIEAEKDPKNKKKMQDLLMRSVLTNTSSTDGLVSCAESMTQYAEQSTKDMSEMEQYLKSIAKSEGKESYANIITAGATVHGILNIGTKASFICMIDTMNRELAFAKGLAASLMRYGLTAGTWKITDSIKISVPDIPIIAAGVLIWLTCFIMTLIFAFKLVDACIRLGVLSMIMPLLLIAFVFPSTKDYAKQGVKTLVHIACVFVVLAIVMALSVLLIMESFQMGLPAHTLDVGEAVKNEANAALSGRLDVYTLYNMGRIKDIAEQLNVTTRAFLGASACMIFAILSLGMVDGTAGELSGMQFGSAVGDKLGGMVTSTAMRTAQMGGRAAKVGAEGAKAVKGRWDRYKQNKGEKGGKGSGFGKSKDEGN